MDERKGRVVYMSGGAAAPAAVLFAAPELCSYIRSSGLKYQKVGCRLGRRSHESFALVSYTSHAIRVHQLILFVSLYCHLWLQTNNFCCRVCRPRRESLRDFIFRFVSLIRQFLGSCFFHSVILEKKKKENCEKLILVSCFEKKKKITTKKQFWL